MFGHRQDPPAGEIRAPRPNRPVGTGDEQPELRHAQLVSDISFTSILESTRGVHSIRSLKP